MRMRLRVGPPSRLVHGDSQRFALDVPQRLVNTTERAGQDVPLAVVAGVTIDRLPMMHNQAGVFANQVRFNLPHRLRRGLRAALQIRFPKPDNSGVGVDLQEQPPRLNKERFEFGDFEIVFRRNRSFIPRPLSKFDGRFSHAASHYTCRRTSQHRTASLRIHDSSCDVRYQHHAV